MLDELMTEAAEPEIAPCPCCGAYAGATLAVAPALLAVCDVLVVSVLQVVGKRLVRSDRARYRALGTRPWHLAHTMWRPDEESIRKPVAGSWDVIPALLVNHGVAGVSVVQVTEMLDQYVRDLLITGTPHRIAELRYRLGQLLGIVLPQVEPYRP